MIGRRLIGWVAVGVACLGFGLAANAAPAKLSMRVPTLEEQLGASRVVPGSALEKLIRRNQDFSVLSEHDFTTNTRLPLWLKAWWRKEHPELEYSSSDPTGGYPLVLKEVLEWMETHQDLKPGLPEPTRQPGWDALSDQDVEGAPRGNAEAGEAGEAARLTVGALSAAIAGNLRVSGSATAPRSESDIRVNFLNPKRSSPPRTTSAGAASRPSSSRRTAAPPGGRRPSPRPPATASTPTRRSTGPRTGPPGP